MTKRKHHEELLSKIEEELAPDRSYNARTTMLKPPKSRLKCRQGIRARRFTIIKGDTT